MYELWKGMLVGISIAAPVGPIALLCIRKTLTQSRLHGLVAGMGAATADACYGLVAALGLSAVAGFLADQASWLHLAGAGFLLALAYRTARAPAPVSVDRTIASGRGLWGTYGTTFALTLTNPMTIVSFAGILSGLNIAERSASSLWLVLGIYAGSAIWWIALCLVVGLLKRSLKPAAMRAIQYVSAIVIAGFGLVSLARFAYG